MKAKLNGIHLKMGQIVNIDGKEYRLKKYSMNVDGNYVLTFENGENELEVAASELSKALGMDIYGYIG